MKISIICFCFDVQSKKEPCTSMSATQQAGLSSRELNHDTHVGFDSSPMLHCHLSNGLTLHSIVSWFSLLEDIRINPLIIGKK